MDMFINEIFVQARRILCKIIMLMQIKEIDLYAQYRLHLNIDIFK